MSKPTIFYTSKLDISLGHRTVASIRYEDNDPGRAQYASAKTLTILLKLFSQALQGSALR
jgi:hypothetical protein